jgi:predicted TIM-barrel fold metal-dependent hydrolase
MPAPAPADPVKEREDALEVSARRTLGLVIEARAEQRAQHDKAVHNLIAQLLAHGLPEYFQIGAGDFSEENDRI